MVAHLETHDLAMKQATTKKRGREDDSRGQGEECRIDSCMQGWNVGESLCCLDGGAVENALEVRNVIDVDEDRDEVELEGLSALMLASVVATIEELPRLLLLS